MIKRSAFSLLELVFVMVIIGILSKFGVDLFAQSYQNFLFTKINNKLQNESATAVEFIAKRLSYRINDSVIGRLTDTSYTAAGYDGIQSIDPTKNYLVLEWVSKDIDGWRGDTLPYWSGIADVDNSVIGVGTPISTPATDVSDINNMIQILSQGTSSISDAALYFIGSNSDVKTGYGWDGNAVTGVGASMHPITIALDNSLDGNFTNVDIYEYYQLAWTANAVAIEDDFKGNGTYNLVFYYDYQPWRGERFKQGKRSVIMENVPTFQFRAIGSMIKIQVCVKSDLTNEEHALCKEKTIF